MSPSYTSIMSTSNLWCKSLATPATASRFLLPTLQCSSPTCTRQQSTSSYVNQMLHTGKGLPRNENHPPLGSQHTHTRNTDTIHAPRLSLELLPLINNDSSTFPVAFFCFVSARCPIGIAERSYRHLYCSHSMQTCRPH